MIIRISRRKSWYVENVPPSVWVVVLKIAKLTEWNSLNINANSAAPLHSGSAGVIHISVSHAIRNSVVATTFPEKQEISYQSVKEKIVR